jgi:putative toxin-antitoxin system antitoxin component (TIGR02293 family)
MRAAARKVADDHLTALAALPELELAEAVRAGLPVSYLDELLQQPGFTMREVDRLVIPRRTLVHRRERRQRLSPDESARLARVVRILYAAREMLGTAAKAERWLREPNRALGGSTPLAVAETEPGARAVEAVLGRIAHGIFS